MGSTKRSWCASVAAALLLASLVGLSSAAERQAKSARRAGEEVEMFAGVKAGQIEVKYIPKNDREGNLLITNKTNKPLNVKLPEAFAARPVLAQFGGQQGGGFGAGGGGGGGQGQVGGGLGGGGGGFGGQGGGGFMNIAPEKVGKAKAICVCAEHGKPDPTPHMAYEIMPVEQYTSDPELQEFAKLFGSGQLDQRAAQATAWHIANDMSWEELAAKKIDRLGRPDEPYFTVAQLRMAQSINSEAVRMAKLRTDESPVESSSSSSSLSQR